MSLYSRLFGKRINNSVTLGVNPHTARLIALQLAKAHDLYKSADYQGSISCCNQVLVLDSTNAAAYQLRGVIRYEMQDLSGASEDLRFCLSIASNENN